MIDWGIFFAGFMVAAAIASLIISLMCFSMATTLRRVRQTLSRQGDLIAQLEREITHDQ